LFVGVVVVVVAAVLAWTRRDDAARSPEIAAQADDGGCWLIYSQDYTAGAPEHQTDEVGAMAASREDAQRQADRANGPSREAGDWPGRVYEAGVAAHEAAVHDRYEQDGRVSIWFAHDDSGRLVGQFTLQRGAAADSRWVATSTSWRVPDDFCAEKRSDAESRTSN